MAMAGEGVERDVAGDADFGGRGLHRLNDSRNKPLRISGL